MGSYLESYISIHVDIPNHIADNPVDWLCEIVCPVVSVRDEAIDESELRKATEENKSDRGTVLIDMLYENFSPNIDFKEDETAVFNGMTDRIRDVLQKAGAMGTINIYGYYTEDAPDVSSFVRLAELPEPATA